MTLEELYRDKPRGEVIITGGELNKTYKAFICHGCQTCCFFEDDHDLLGLNANVIESYPHYLSIEEITCPPTSLPKSGKTAEPATSTQTPEA